MRAPIAWLLASSSMPKPSGRRLRCPQLLRVGDPAGSRLMATQSRRLLLGRALLRVRVMLLLLVLLLVVVVVRLVVVVVVV
eukprot:SAG25_NODE_262_length_10711_cov_10.264512_10_plen_81_part_00